MAMTFGQRLKAFRKNEGWTQQDLADMIGVSTQAISKWETDVGMPDISQIVPLSRALNISTDILLGFPGETEEDFQLTLQLVKDIGYEMACMYYYNPREGTAAYSFENQVPLDLKKSRLKQLIDMQQEIGQQEMRKRVGSEMKVLVECVSRDNEKELLARTEQDGHVVFTGDASLIGSFVWVKITELTGNTFRGIVK